MSKPIRVLIVDAETLLRHCLTIALNRRRGLQVVGEVDTGDRGVAEVRSLRPDVVVVDPSFPNGGPPLVAEISAAASGSAVIVLTNNWERVEGRETLLAGARGYLLKNSGLDDLVRMIERVHAGELVLASGVADTVMNDFGVEQARVSSLDGLTDRELEVLRLIAKGLTNSKIAGELCITEHTVKGHLAKILGKLGLGNRVQLTAYAHQQGLIEPAEPVVARRNH